MKNMKKIALLAVAALVLFSCVSKKSADRVEAERDELAREVAVKDSLIDDVFTSLNSISENLYAITTRENIVTSNVSGEIGVDQKTRISEDIAAIDLLLQENRATIQRLKNSTEGLRRANARIQELERLVENMTVQVAQKDADLASLRERLAALDIEGETLTQQVNTLSVDKAGLEATVALQTDALNEVYYIVGEDKELIDAGVVYKSGIFGRTMKVVNNYDLGKFTRVDRTGVDEIFVGHRKVTIVTTHPEGSYELVEGERGLVESIRIRDKARFWESSKILVVSYKK